MLTPYAVSTHMRYLSQKGEVKGERPLGHGLTWRGNSKGTRAWSESGGQRRQLVIFQSIGNSFSQVHLRKPCDTSMWVGYLLISCETTLPLHDWARLAR